MSRSVEKRGGKFSFIKKKIVVSSWYMWLFLNRYGEIVYSVLFIDKQGCDISHKEEIVLSCRWTDAEVWVAENRKKK